MKLNLQTAGTLILSLGILIAQPSYALTIYSQPANTDAATATPATQSTGATESAEATQPTVTEESPVNYENAMKEFKSLPKQERKARISDAKNELKEYKKNKREGKDDPSTNTLLLVILAILLPPLAVYLHEGEINSKFWIDLLLTLLFYLPGMIYALIVVLSK